MRENCRTCLNYLKIEDSVSVNLRILENKSVLDLLQEWASIEVAKADQLPSVICKTCYLTVKSFTDFIVLAGRSDTHFKQKLFKDDDIPNIKQKCEPRVVERIKGELRDKDTKKHDISDSKKIYHLNKCKNENDESDGVIIKHNFSLENGTKENFKSTFFNMGKKAAMLYECLKCEKSFKRLYQYKMHMNVHTGERNYLCTICGKYFSRSYVLIYHMRVHTGEKKFSCNICNKSFIHPSNLYKHKKIHTDTRNYKCEWCNKSFIQSEALKIHIRRIHTGEKPFLCEICSKSFSSQSAFCVHKQDRHEKKESCTICKKLFSTRILKRHIERHKNKEEDIKKCICEQCGKNFSSDYNLRQHLLSHNGMKPYASQPIPCTLCKKLYSKRRIKNHICIAVKN